MHSLVIHETPEAVWEAMWGENILALKDATFGGIDNDGNDTDPFSTSDALQGIEETGIWGFVNLADESKPIHVWFAPDASMKQLISFFAHELAHVKDLDQAPCADEQEAWAIRIEQLAAEAFELAEYCWEQGMTETLDSLIAHRLL
jgi:hypothetical protein